MSQTTTSNKFDKKWEELRPQVIELAQTTTSNKFDEKWEELKPTVENNVSLNADSDGYYVLTESKDKNIKKLDYYYRHNFTYSPKAPYYTTTLYIWGLDLEEYTVEESLLNNNMCKLIQPHTDQTTSELIDYVYLMLDTVTVIKVESDNAIELVIKYLPYFAKLKTDTPTTGQCYLNACISVIFKKTSS